MRPLLALLALLWALVNLYVAYLFVVNGFVAKTVQKGIGVMGSLILGGVLIAVFALILVVQAVRLAISRTPDDAPDATASERRAAA